MKNDRQLLIRVVIKSLDANILRLCQYHILNEKQIKRMFLHLTILCVCLVSVESTFKRHGFWTAPVYLASTFSKLAVTVQVSARCRWYFLTSVWSQSSWSGESPVCAASYQLLSSVARSLANGWWQSSTNKGEKKTLKLRVMQHGYRPIFPRKKMLLCAQRERCW